MRFWPGLLWAGAVALGASLPLVMGDGVRGQALFKSQGCMACHALNGAGGRSAPDLGVRGGRGFSPAGLAALMWNHAPRMWEQIQKRKAPPPAFGEQQAADLFAYFYAARYFDRPGDARRGREVFSERQCSTCHGSKAAGPGGAPPATQWKSAGDPIALAQQLWNHSGKMHEAMAQRKIPYYEMTTEDLTDVVAYVRRLTRASASLTPPGVGSTEAGAKLFQEKLCAACHTGDFDLRNRRTRFSLTDFAASLWNHAPGMPGKRPELSYDEMRHLMAYLGAMQYFEESGNLARGEEAFRRKKCTACHGDPASGAPELPASTAGRISSYEMVAVLWRHGPTMLEGMRRQKIAWPEFTPVEMSDLVTYLHGPRLKRR